MASLRAWTAVAFLAGALVGAALVFPGDITHPFSAPGSKGQVLMHFQNDGASAQVLHVTLKDGAGRTILDEEIRAGPQRTTDRAAVNLLAGRYTLVVANGNASARLSLDVAACRGASYYEVRYDVSEDSISTAAPECVTP